MVTQSEEHPPNLTRGAWRADPGGDLPVTHQPPRGDGANQVQDSFPESHGELYRDPAACPH